MKIARLMGFAITATMLLGCVTSGKPDQKPGSTQTLVSNCIAIESEANTCEIVNGNAVCPVYVFSSSSGPAISPFTLTVPYGSPLTIVWRNGNPMASFMSTDGPLELKTDSNFTLPSPTNDANGQGPGLQSGTHYRIKYNNTQMGQSFKYTIRFHNAIGQELTCDPFINNSGG